MEARKETFGCNYSFEFSAELGGAGGGDDLDDLDTALSNLEVKLGGEAEPPSPLVRLGGTGRGWGTLWPH